MQGRDLGRGLDRARKPVGELGNIAESIANGGRAEQTGTGYTRTIDIDFVIRRTEFENDPLWEPFGRLINFYKGGRGTKLDMTVDGVRTTFSSNVNSNLVDHQNTNSEDKKNIEIVPYTIMNVSALGFDYFQGIFGFTGNLLLSNSNINASEFVEYRNKDVTNERVEDLSKLSPDASRRLTEFLVKCAGLREYDSQHEAARGILYLDSKHPNIWIIRIEGVNTLKPFMAAVGYI